MTSTAKDFNVAIVGGGMCGLPCALELLKHGIDVHVFEAAPKFSQVGAGIGLGPNALRALDGLGLLQAILKKAAKEAQPDQHNFSFISGTDQHEHVLEFKDFATIEGDTGGITIYRPDFLDALFPLIDPKAVHFGKKCTQVEKVPSGRYMLHFADGTTFEADLVIGADGIKSTVRKAVVGEDSIHQLHFPNAHGYRALVHVDDSLKAAPLYNKVLTESFVWVGVGKHMVTYPIKDGAMLNFVAFAQASDEGIQLCPERPGPWVEAVTSQELLDIFAGWGNDAMTILKHLDKVDRWAVHTLHPPMESYVKEKLVLVGDSAHAMLPHLAAGAGQGLEDVYALCRLLTLPKTRKSNLDAVLGVYNKLRPPHANMVLEKGIKNLETYCNYGPGKYGVDDMRRNLAGLWEPIWHYDLQTAVSDAIDRDLGSGPIASN